MRQTVKSSTRAGIWQDASGITHYLHRITTEEGQFGTAMTMQAVAWWELGSVVDLQVVGYDPQGVPRLELTRGFDQRPQPDHHSDILARWAMGLAAQITGRPPALNGTPPHSPKLDKVWIERVAHVAALVLTEQNTLAAKIEAQKRDNDSGAPDEVKTPGAPIKNAPGDTWSDTTRGAPSWT